MVYWLIVNTGTEPTNQTEANEMKPSQSIATRRHASEFRNNIMIPLKLSQVAFLFANRRGTSERLQLFFISL